MTDIASIHDKFLRTILADRETAIDYFRCCLPQHIASLIDLSTLVQLPDTYISKELRKTASDIVYSCRAKGRKQNMKISLLLEHKSKPEPFTPVQVLGYIASGYSKQIAQEKSVSPIIPVLLYHGKVRWPYRTLAMLFKDLRKDLRPFIPDYEYLFHDLGEIPEGQINALENKFLRASLIALKYSQLKEQLAKLIPTILSLAMDTQENLRTSLFVYTFGVSGLEEDRINGILEDIPTNIKDTVMNTLDIFVEKGKKIGLEAGRIEGGLEKTEKAVRNMILRGYADTEICDVLEVSTDYVARIRQEILNETAPNQ